MLVELLLYENASKTVSKNLKSKKNRRLPPDTRTFSLAEAITFSLAEAFGLDFVIDFAGGGAPCYA